MKAFCNLWFIILIITLSSTNQKTINEVVPSSNKELLSIIKPKMFLFENVTGILSMNNGKLFKEVQECFKDIGYELKYKVLNANETKRFVIVYDSSSVDNELLLQTAVRYAEYTRKNKKAPKLYLIDTQTNSTIITDLEESNWFTIGVVSLLDYDIKPKITTSGLYMAPIAGVAKIRMVSENPVGDFKVFAVSVD